MTAKFIRDLPGFRGSAKLWKIGNRYVVTSAVNAPDTGRAETFVFEADENGKVTNWSELVGSFRGDLDHDQAIQEHVRCCSSNYDR